MEGTVGTWQRVRKLVDFDSDRVGKQYKYWNLYVKEKSDHNGSNGQPKRETQFLNRFLKSLAMSSYDMRMTTTPSRLPGTSSSRYFTTTSELVGNSPVDISADGSSIFMRDDTNSRIRVVNLDSGEVDEYGITRPALLNAKEEALYHLVIIGNSFVESLSPVPHIMYYIQTVS